MHSCLSESPCLICRVGCGSSSTAAERWSGLRIMLLKNCCKPARFTLYTSNVGSAKTKHHALARVRQRAMRATTSQPRRQSRAVFTKTPWRRLRLQGPVSSRADAGGFIRGVGSKRGGGREGKDGVGWDGYSRTPKSTMYPGYIVLFVGYTIVQLPYPGTGSETSYNTLHTLTLLCA